ncbi:MAG TPA: hypothetical protein VJL58_10155 [Pyrinomonadaceae bacterium]|nr:hypothetical protein [Pyrinomonadaceae bacterium]
MNETPYPIQVFILTMLNMVPTVLYIWLIWQWRSLTDKPWMRAAFTWVPVFLAAVIVYRICVWLGFRNAEVLLVLQYLYVATSYLIVYMFGYATRIVRRSDVEWRMKQAAERSETTSEILGDIQKRGHQMNAILQNFLKKAGT